jgi:hypothetical protein
MAIHDIAGPRCRRARTIGAIVRRALQNLNELPRLLRYR